MINNNNTNMEEVIKEIEECVKHLYVSLPNSSVYMQAFKDGAIVTSETIIRIIRSYEKAKNTNSNEKKN